MVLLVMEWAVIRGLTTYLKWCSLVELLAVPLTVKVAALGEVAGSDNSGAGGGAGGYSGGGGGGCGTGSPYHNALTWRRRRFLQLWVEPTEPSRCESGHGKVIISALNTPPSDLTLSGPNRTREFTRQFNCGYIFHDRSR